MKRFLTGGKIPEIILAVVLILALLMMSAPVFAEDSEAQTDAAEGIWKNILLLGVDSRDYSKIDRSDCMIILSVNDQTARVKMTSVMRDTWVHFPGTSRSGKINAATVYGGPELAVQTVNECFGTDIEKYILVNFQDLTDIIDLIGGIDIEITEQERRKINEKATEAIYDYEGARTLDEAGLVHMNGALALAYARDRYSTGAGDFDRVKRQRNVLKASLVNIQKCAPDELISVIVSFLPCVKTNMTISEITALAPLALKTSIDQIRELTIPADGTFKSGMMDGEWKIKPDFAKNKEILHSFIVGDTAELEELSVGSSGIKVLNLQKKLVQLGMLRYADGIYGDLTRKAVMDAQKQLGLEATGVADVEFQKALLEMQD